MEIKLLEGRYQDGEPFAHMAGEVITVGDDEALRLIEAGSAEPVARKASARRETRTAA